MMSELKLVGVSIAQVFALTIDESEAISPAWQDLLQVVNSGLEAAEYQGFRG
jgi:hypothetical protein